MDTNGLSASKPVTTTRSKKWAMGMTSALLSLSLILAACGGDEPDDAGVVPGDDAVVATPVGDDAVIEPADDDADVDLEATAEAAEETETETSEVVDTETDVITETDVTTDTQVIIETDVVTDVDVTTLVTDTVVTTATESDVETDTQVETGTTTETETDVETGTVTTGTEGVDTTQAVTETGAVDTDAATTTGTGAAMMGVSGVEEGQYVRASTLLDYDFENTDGEVSGDLEDLLIDLSTGRVLFTAIEYGGILDLGDKDVVVPLNAFAVGPEGELVLNIDEATLENYPDVGNDWPDLNDPAWDDDVRTFWSESGIETGAGFDEATTSVARASELLGHNIADLGAGAGSILDILVNLGTGQAPYFVVDYGEGLDTDPYIIPVSAFDTANWQEGLNYGSDFTPDMLEDAPRFDQEAYPTGSPIDTDFGDTVESWWNDMGFSNDVNNDGQVD